MSAAARAIRPDSKYLDLRFVRTQNMNRANPMKIKAKLSALILLFIVIVCLFGCAGVADVGINNSYKIDSLTTIGIYFQPSGKPFYDKQLYNVLSIKLSSLGYTLVNLSPPMTRIKGNISKFQGHVETAQNLFMHDGKSCDAIITVHTKWIDVTRGGDGRTFFLDKLNFELMMFDKKLSVIASRNFDEVEKVHKDEKEHKYLKSPIRFLMQRAVGNTFEPFPVCKQENDRPATYQFPVVMFVDTAYINLYGADWEPQLKLRWLFVNDAYKKNFDMEFVVKDYRAWSPLCDTSIEKSLDDLQEQTKLRKNLIVVGIMLNKQVIFNWRDRNAAGVTALHHNVVVVSDLPTVFEGTDWDAHEEASLWIHELGHVFGAFHIYDCSSTMYPTLSCMSYKFDSLNASIIKTYRDTCWNVPLRTRVSKNIIALCRAFDSCHTGSIQVLSRIYADAGEYSKKDYQKNDTLVLDSLRLEDVARWTTNVALKEALTGYYYLQHKNYKFAEEHLLKTIEMDPKYIEAYEYLSETYEKLGDKEKEEQYSKLADDRIDALLDN
jgi:hypothetical protein